MLTTRGKIIGAGLLLVASTQVLAQDVTPPPGFSPSAPRASAPSSGGPGFLQRLGGSSGQQSSDQPDDSVIPGGPFSNSPSNNPSSGPDFSPTPSYMNGNYPQPNNSVIYPVPAPYAPRFWLKAEALYWWTKSSPLSVPIITQGSVTDPIPGAMGQPNTSVLIGDQSISLPGRGGGRFSLGFALDQDATWALEGSYFFLSSVSVSQGVSSDGSASSALLALPFFNPATSREEATYIAIPGAFSGTAVLTLGSFVQGAEANLLYNLSNGGNWRWDALAGFRYFNLQESLTLDTSSPNVPPSAPDFFNTFDRFNTQNNFYGGQIGARATYENPWIFVNGTAKLALGSTIETVSTSGALFSSFGSAPGAYLTQPTNLGSLSQAQFAVIPSADLNFGIRLSPWASVVVGYSFMYVSSVARPGDQIDRVINPSQAPAISGTFPGALSGPARPTLVVRDTDFWVQGLTFTLQLQY